MDGKWKKASAHRGSPVADKVVNHPVRGIIASDLRSVNPSVAIHEVNPAAH